MSSKSNREDVCVQEIREEENKEAKRRSNGAYREANSSED